MQRFISNMLSASSVLANLKALVLGPVDRIALAADVGGVLSRRQFVDHSDRNGGSGWLSKPQSRRRGPTARQLRPRPALTVALLELATILATCRPSRIRSSLRALSQLT